MSPLIFQSDPFSLSPQSYTESSGGDEGIRTLDPLLAGQVLSQLSYTPKFLGSCMLGVLRTLKIEQLRQRGFIHPCMNLFSLERR